jgi:hypothetical protein
MKKEIEIKRGMVFRTKHQGTRCVVANVFFEGEQKVITWRYWSVRKQRWYFETDWEKLFVIGFDYGDVWLNKKSKPKN